MIRDSIHFVFFGTPELSVEILEHLKSAGFVPQLIVTNPDRPQGRKMLLTPPPVKLWAQKNGIKFLQPEKLDSVFNSQLATYNPQLFIVVAYGKILPSKVLSIPKKGTLNIHYSLLPKYRGASPIESAILNDDRDTGVAILLLDEKMDHGPIVAERRLEIQNPKSEISNGSEGLTIPSLSRDKSPARLRLDEVQAGGQIPNGNKNIQASKQSEWPMRASELRKEMNHVAGELLVKTIPRWVAGEINAVEQDHSKATYTKKFTKADGEVDLSGDPYKNFLKIRAFDDSIGTHFFAHKQGKKIRIVIKDAECRDGKLVFTRVIPEGKKEMSYEEFSRGLIL